MSERDLKVVHQYFGVDTEIIWDIVRTKLPELEDAVKHLLENACKEG